MPKSQVQTQRVDIRRFYKGQTEQCPDVLAVEEPLEIRLAYDDGSGFVVKPISITMRTPGHDPELAVGFLYSEGILQSANQIAEVVQTGPPGYGTGRQNVVTLRLDPEARVDLKRLERHFYTTSSCGVCGKASLDALALTDPPAIPANQPRVASDIMYRLPEMLRQRQAVFEQTGGLHAAALFNADGTFLDLREDVGRHNAMDKLVGRSLLDGTLPLHECLLLLSGRASFELLQKAVMAGLPLVAAVGAPSSLAVDLAERFGVTLLGFVRENRFNIYTAPERLLP